MTAFILTATLSLAAAQENPQAALDEKIAAARQKAIEFLKKEQTKEGHWEKVVLNLLDMEGGCTGMATLALLEAGVPAKDPSVAKAIEYLVKLEPKKTYVVSLQTQVLARADAKKHAAQLQKNADWLFVKAVRKDGKLQGWSYPGQDLADNSNTHFAVMALQAALQAGAKVDGKVWEQIRDLYVRSQSASGWGYYNDRGFDGGRATLSMTTCGLVGLSVAAKNDKNAKAADADFEKGRAALLKMDGGPSKSEGYNRMATAELGRALGVKEFKSGKAGRAWYREGAEKLLREQNQDGSFTGRPNSIDGTPVLSTAFGLYFLGPPAKK
jgi:hypothetical protein